MLHFGQVFLFWRLINKNFLEWFLPIICKEHTLTKSTTTFSRSFPKLCFELRRECRQMPTTEHLVHQTDKNSHRRCSIKKAVLKNLSIFIGKQLCWSLFLIKLSFQTCNFIRKGLQHRCFPVAKLLRKSILKNASELL